MYLFVERYAWDYLENDEILSCILDLSDYDALIEVFPHKYKEFTFQLECFELHDLVMGGSHIAIVNGRIVELMLDDLNLDEFPEALTRLSALEKLWISYNNIKSLPKTLENLKKLKVLDIRQNLIKELPDSIINLPSLEGVWLSGNQIENIPEKIKKIKKPSSN